MSTPSEDLAIPPPEAGAAASLDDRLEWFRAMLEIRAFEGECHRLFAQGLVRGSTHLCDGQEAVAVGVARALRPGDTMSCTYRGHGAVLAMGAPLDRAFGEILGKADGLCGGKGGSMHLTDIAVGAIGSFAVVGAHLPISVGAAFAARYRKTGAVSGVLLRRRRDQHRRVPRGAQPRGHRGRCQSSSSARTTFTASTRRSPPPLRSSDSPTARTAYGMRTERIDGNDVPRSRAVASARRASARRLEGPTFIEAMTYRQRGHSRYRPGAYRPAGELERWLERDPILLLERGSGRRRRVAERSPRRGPRRGRAAVGAALERAQAYADPDPASRFDHVFA